MRKIALLLNNKNAPISIQFSSHFHISQFMIDHASKDNNNVKMLNIKHNYQIEIILLIITCKLKTGTLTEQITLFSILINSRKKYR